MNLADLQQSIYDRLTATVSGSFVGIYDSVAPEPVEPGDDTRFPYITVGPMPAVPMDTKGDNGAEVVAQVHIWSRSPDLVSRALADVVYDALQKYDLPVSGADVVDCRFDGADEFTDSDGITRHIVTRWRVTYFLT